MKRITLSLATVCFCVTAFAKDQPIRPRIMGIAQVRLLVTNVNRSRDFYGSILNIGRRSNRCLQTESYCFSLDQDQQIILGQPDHFSEAGLPLEVAFQTEDAAHLRAYFASKGTTPGPLLQSSEGNQWFAMNAPEGHQVVFVQYPSRDNSITVVNQISTHMIHAGFVVHDRAAEDKFFKDILGFHVYWHGGMKEGEDNWVDMQVPDGTDWIEYMLRVSPDASHKTLGVMNHIALGVPDIHAAQQQLIKNGWKGTEEPKIGRDGKWQLNLYDPDETRVELMEFKPTKEPCCSPYTGPHPGP